MQAASAELFFPSDHSTPNRRSLSRSRSGRLQQSLLSKRIGETHAAKVAAIGIDALTLSHAVALGAELRRKPFFFSPWRSSAGTPGAKSKMTTTTIVAAATAAAVEQQRRRQLLLRRRYEQRSAPRSRSRSRSPAGRPRRAGTGTSSSRSYEQGMWLSNNAAADDDDDDFRAKIQRGSSDSRRRRRRSSDGGGGPERRIDYGNDAVRSGARADGEGGIEQQQQELLYGNGGSSSNSNIVFRVAGAAAAASAAASAVSDVSWTSYGREDHHRQKRYRSLPFRHGSSV